MTELVVIVVIVLFVLVLLDGLRRKFSNRERVVMKLDKAVQREALDENSFPPELPNGGARTTVRDGDELPVPRKPAPKLKTARARQQIETTVRVPVLMDSVELEEEKIEHTNVFADTSSSPAGDSASGYYADDLSDESEEYEEPVAGLDDEFEDPERASANAVTSVDTDSDEDDWDEGLDDGLEDDLEKKPAYLPPLQRDARGNLITPEDDDYDYEEDDWSEDDEAEDDPYEYEPEQEDVLLRPAASSVSEVLAENEVLDDEELDDEDLDDEELDDEELDEEELDEEELDEDDEFDEDDYEADYEADYEKEPALLESAYNRAASRFSRVTEAHERIEPGFGEDEFDDSAFDDNFGSALGETNSPNKAAAIEASDEFADEDELDAEADDKVADSLHGEKRESAAAKQSGNERRGFFGGNFLGRKDQAELFSEEQHADDVEDVVEEGPQEVIIINVMSPAGSLFRGPDLMAILQQQGMRLGDMSIFHRYSGHGGSGSIVFSMANMVKPGTFDLTGMDDFATPGVSFFLQLPNKNGNMLSFDQMLTAANALKHRLAGELKDENRSVFTRQTIEHCRQRILDFELSLLARK